MNTTTTTAAVKPMTSVERATLGQDTNTLKHIIKSLESDLLQACEMGIKGTQAHIGMLEMMEACSKELRLRAI